MNKDIDRNELKNYIHDEIAANGTSSIFVERIGDDGEYNAEEIADAIISGEIEFDTDQFEF